MKQENPVAADDRSYRYGDGLFETMKVKESKLLLASLHFERLFHGIKKLQITMPAHFSKEKLEKEIIDLCEKNDCANYARVRLSVSAGNGGLYDPGRDLNYIIEAWPLSLEMEHLNSNGLELGIYRDAFKSCDELSSLKSSSFLIYSQASLMAKANKWNDAIVLNTKERIADSTIANIFLVKNKKIITPSLQEGCIAGVMRRLLLAELPGWGYEVEEKGIMISELDTANEIFLTNAIRGIRWVKRLGDIKYVNDVSKEIYGRLQTIWK